MNTSQREPGGDTAPVLTFNIEIHHRGKSARYCRASRPPRHAFCCGEPMYLQTQKRRPKAPFIGDLRSESIVKSKTNLPKGRITDARLGAAVVNIILSDTVREVRLVHHTPIVVDEIGEVINDHVGAAAV